MLLITIVFCERKRKLLTTEEEVVVEEENVVEDIVVEYGEEEEDEAEEEEREREFDCFPLSPISRHRDISVVRSLVIRPLRSS